MDPSAKSLIGSRGLTITSDQTLTINYNDPGMQGLTSYSSLLVWKTVHILKAAPSQRGCREVTSQMPVLSTGQNYKPSEL